jgi:hypothetical protein
VESAHLAEDIISSSGYVDLYWIPLGAGGHFVRFNGRVFEALAARGEKRARQDLYHSALVVGLPDGVSVIEMAWPVPKEPGSTRGAVVQGPVGWHWAGHFRAFRYEIRCWLHGTIADISFAVESPLRVADDAADARRLLALVPLVPQHIWGRDELGAGEMWNSNSCISWLLQCSGLHIAGLRPPQGGRAPGWEAGLMAARQAPPDSDNRNQPRVARPE